MTDTERRTIGEGLFEAGQVLGAEATFSVMIPREANGQEPPDQIAAAMSASEVVVVPTTRSLTHTQARNRAVECGARVATMPGITEDMFRAGAITADYSRVEDLTRHVRDLLDEASEAVIETGHRRLRMDVRGRKAIASTGIYREPGASGNLPSGEAFLAPIEGSAEGEIMIDGSIAGVGLLEEPVVLRVEGGRLVSASGEAGTCLLEILDTYPEGRNLAELGIGTNEKARLTGVTLEDEKILGSIHIAFGSNDSFGGRVAAGIHLDAVTLQPGVYVDGQLTVFQGQVRI